MDWAAAAAKAGIFPDPCGVPVVPPNVAGDVALWPVMGAKGEVTLNHSCWLQSSIHALTANPVIYHLAQHLLPVQLTAIEDALVQLIAGRPDNVKGDGLYRILLSNFQHLVDKNKFWSPVCKALETILIEACLKHDPHYTLLQQCIAHKGCTTYILGTYGLLHDVITDKLLRDKVEFPPPVISVKYGRPTKCDGADGVVQPAVFYDPDEVYVDVGRGRALYKVTHAIERAAKIDDHFVCRVGLDILNRNKRDEPKLDNPRDGLINGDTYCTNLFLIFHSML
jgi:hypothetical protein